jgi:hypothetical protein
MKKFYEKLRSIRDYNTIPSQDQGSMVKSIFNLLRIHCTLIRLGEVFGLAIYPPEVSHYLEMGVEIAEVLWHIIFALKRKK